MTKTLKTTKTSLKPCECSLWEFDLDVDRDEDYNTGCTAMTHRTFAQGHDAKLVGFLVRADLAGHDISKRDGGMLVTFQNAIHAAGTISEALATKTEAMYTAQINRAKAKAAKKATKTEAPAPTTREAKIKVGRWEYDATIQIADGGARYTTKAGVEMVAGREMYTEVK